LQQVPGRQKNEECREQHDVSHVFRARGTHINAVIEKTPDRYEWRGDHPGKITDRCFAYIWQVCQDRNEQRSRQGVCDRKSERKKHGPFERQVHGVHKDVATLFADCFSDQRLSRMRDSIETKSGQMLKIQQYGIGGEDHAAQTGALGGDERKGEHQGHGAHKKVGVYREKGLVCPDIRQACQRPVSRTLS